MEETLLPFATVTAALIAGLFLVFSAIASTVTALVVSNKQTRTELKKDYLAERRAAISSFIQHMTELEMGIVEQTTSVMTFGFKSDEANQAGARTYQALKAVQPLRSVIRLWITEDSMQMVKKYFEVFGELSDILDFEDPGTEVVNELKTEIRHATDRYYTTAGELNMVLVREHMSLEVP